MICVHDTATPPFISRPTTPQVSEMLRREASWVQERARLTQVPARTPPTDTPPGIRMGGGPMMWWAEPGEREERLAPPSQT